MTKKEIAKNFLLDRSCYTCLHRHPEMGCGLPITFRYGQKLPKEKFCKDWQNKIIYWISDPTVGMSVLSKPGVFFNKAMKDEIKKICIKKL